MTKDEIRRNPNMILRDDLQATVTMERQKVMQRVKRRELEALYVNRGRRKGLRIKVIDAQIPLLDTTPAEEV